MALIVNQATKRLSEILRRWIDEKSSRSVKSLSNKAGISYQTVLRAVNCEGNTSFINSLALLEVAATDEEKEAWLTDFHPNVISNTKLNNEEIHPLLKRMFKLLGERSVIEIFLYLFDENFFVKKSFLLENYGHRAQIFLDELERLGCLQTDDGEKLKIVNLEQFSEVHFLIKLLNSGLKNLESLTEITHFYGLVFFTGSYSRQGIIALRAMIKEYHERIIQLEKVFPGNHRIEMGAMVKPLNIFEAKKLPIKS